MNRLLILFFLSVAACLCSPHDLLPEQDHSAEKKANLEAFFAAHHCPQPFHAAEYVSAADENSIDYRLLPAVSVRESTCGWYQRKNNRWGWDSARTGFASVPQGIRFVAHEIATAPAYRDKDVPGVLWTYNPLPRYAGEVLKLMREIAPDPESGL